MATEIDADLNYQLTGRTFAILGAGTIGTLIVQGLIRARVSPGNVRATAKHGGRAIAVADGQTVSVSADNRSAVHQADVVLICVKPTDVSGVLNEVAREFSPDAVVVSTVAGVSTAALEAAVATPIAVVRAMPNTPCRIGEGMTVISRGRFADDRALNTARSIFRAMGQTAEADENLMDAVTALSASGPAFAFTILEALAEGGVRVGLPRELATRLATQAMLGAASMVASTGLHPAVLMNQVTTPAGCTIEGILALEEGRVRATLIRAISVTAGKASRLTDTRDIPKC